MIPVEKIWDVQARKKGRVGRGILFGAGIGLLLGATIGLATYQPCKSQAGSLGFDGILDDPAFNAVGGGVIGLIAGGAIGLSVVGPHQQFFS